MKFETEYIEKLAEIISKNGLTEISMEDGEQAITIRKEMLVSSAPVIGTPAIQPAVVQTETPTTVAKEQTTEVKKNGTPITSPMVGTFYMAPAPDAEPFVTVGKPVKQGDVVCIIEAMKMMNEIKTESAGKIIEICVEDGQPVEYGQVLMYVE